MPQIDIPEQELAGLFSARILDSLSAETKEKMISEALKYLLVEPKRDGYYGQKEPSPLQQSFDRAMNRIAIQLADEVIAEQGVSEKVKALFVELFENIPDIREDWGLQSAVIRAVFNYLDEQKRKKDY
jgi:hypothetical protein